MVEAISHSNDCSSYGTCTDEQTGTVLSRDMHFRRAGKLFDVRVGTAKYLQRIRALNEQVENDPVLSLDTQILVLDDVSDPNEVCKKLTATLPFEQIEPFAVEINLEEAPDS